MSKLSKITNVSVVEAVFEENITRICFEKAVKEFMEVKKLNILKNIKSIPIECKENRSKDSASIVRRSPRNKDLTDTLSMPAKRTRKVSKCL